MSLVRIFAFVIAAFSTILFQDYAEAQTIVSYNGLPRGTILIKTDQRRLYLGLGNNNAIAYPVGVGRSGRQWSGQKRVTSKRIRPAWKPTRDILAVTGGAGKVIPGGSPKNPMGAAALVLSGDGQYAIHGTNKPSSIGGFVSFGCIRMHNKDILDLYKRVGIGTKVIVH